MIWLMVVSIIGLFFSYVYVKHHQLVHNIVALIFLFLAIFAMINLII